MTQKLLCVLALCWVVMGCDNHSATANSDATDVLAEREEFMDVRVGGHFNRCDGDAAIFPYATDNQIVVTGINKWISTGVDVACAYTETFETDNQDYNLLIMHYGPYMDCPAGCISNSICAFGTAEDLRLLNASWHSSTGQPEGISGICDVNPDGDNLIASCPIVLDNQVDYFYSTAVTEFILNAQAGNTDTARQFQSCFF